MVCSKCCTVRSLRHCPGCDHSQECLLCLSCCRDPGPSAAAVLPVEAREPPSWASRAGREGPRKCRVRRGQHRSLRWLYTELTRVLCSDDECMSSCLPRLYVPTKCRHWVAAFQTCVLPTQLSSSPCRLPAGPAALLPASGGSAPLAIAAPSRRGKQGTHAYPDGTIGSSASQYACGSARAFRCRHCFEDPSWNIFVGH
jgi:hypothetical protein